MLVCHADLLTIDPALHRQGIGTTLLHEMASALMAVGVSRIDTYAARGPAMNGYYTWPTLGYNAPLADAPTQVRTALERAGYHINGDLLDLLANPGGEAMWLRIGDSMPMSFDLSPKSKSWKVLAAYIAREKRKQRRRR